MTARRLTGGLLVAMWLGAAGMVISLIATWPPDLPWELVRYALITLWVVGLAWVSRAFLRQSEHDAAEHLDERGP